MTTKQAFVIYPEDFLSYTKFERKLSNIFRNGPFVINYELDPNSFIEKFCTENNAKKVQFKSPEEALSKSTHAIFFEDRECYFTLKQIVFDMKIPYRTIVIELTKVSNKDRGDAYDLYVGRGTIWGNPYQMGTDGNREEVIRKFQYDFDNGLLKASADFEKNIEPLKGKVIACHCKPAACHGDVIALYLNSLDDGK